MFVILIMVVPLVAWSLHLMQQAIERREFSLMLAGTLVAAAAAAMVGVYFLMGEYMNYVSQMAQNASWLDNSGEIELITSVPRSERKIETWANWNSSEIANLQSIAPNANFN